jgi:hypothetical protein
MLLSENHFDFVAGYNIADFIWPSAVTIATENLSFVFGTSNLRLFKVNYEKTKKFTARMGGDLSFMAGFNVQTYTNLVTLDFQDKLG